MKDKENIVSDCLICMGLYSLYQKYQHTYGDHNIKVQNPDQYNI